MAALAGRTDSDDYVRQIVQHAFRQVSDVEGPHHGANASWVAEGLYQQLVGTFGDDDLRRLSEWRRVSWVPEYVEGANGWAHERTLSDKAKAELARVDPFP